MILFQKPTIYAHWGSNNNFEWNGLEDKVTGKVINMRPTTNHQTKLENIDYITRGEIAKSTTTIHTIKRVFKVLVCRFL